VHRDSQSDSETASRKERKATGHVHVSAGVPVPGQDKLFFDGMGLEVIGIIPARGPGAAFYGQHRYLSEDVRGLCGIVLSPERKIITSDDFRVICRKSASPDILSKT
jgi:hypothetical protein